MAGYFDVMIDRGSFGDVIANACPLFLRGNAGSRLIMRYGDIVVV